MAVIAAAEGARKLAGLTRSFAEPDDFASAMLGGQFDYMPLKGEPFAATLRLLCVGDMVVQHVTTAAHVARGAIAPGMAVLILNVQGTHRVARVNGAEVGATEAVLAIGGAELTAYSPQPLDWAALALPLPLLEELTDVAPPALRAKGTVTFLTLPPGLAARLVGALSAARCIAEDIAMLLDTPGSADGLAKALREELAAALTAESGHGPRPRAVGQSLRYVAAAAAFMEERLDQPVYTEDLCAALGVSARRLHDAFRAAVDMSPHAYLKSRRMMLVRRALLNGECGPDLVKSVALGHGFWHLGHFARDYRAQFGELPSETIRHRHSSHGRRH